MVRPLPDGSPDVAAFLKTVVERQGMTVEVYRRDAVWPTVALRKLTSAKVQVTEEDVRNGFEANYGPRARCRVIVLSQLRRAEQVWEMARKHPTADYFGDLAAQYSVEGSSRALRGETPPIAKHCGQPVLEKEAFALKPGEMSGVIQLGDKFIILFCEGYTKPEVVELANVRDLIEEDVRGKKQRLAMSEFFERLQDTASIDNFLSTKSQSSQRRGADGDVACPTSAKRRGTTKDSDSVARKSIPATGSRAAVHDWGNFSPCATTNLRSVPGRSSGFAAFSALLLRPCVANDPALGDFPAPAAFLFPPFPLELGFRVGSRRGSFEPPSGQRRGTIFRGRRASLSIGS